MGLTDVSFTLISVGLLAAGMVAAARMFVGVRPNGGTLLAAGAILVLLVLIYLIMLAYGDDFKGSSPSDQGMRLVNLVHAIALLVIVIGFIRSNKKWHL